MACSQHLPRPAPVSASDSWRLRQLTELHLCVLCAALQDGLSGVSPPRKGCSSEVAHQVLLGCLLSGKPDSFPSALQSVVRPLLLGKNTSSAPQQQRLATPRLAGLCADALRSFLGSC